MQRYAFGNALEATILTGMFKATYSTNTVRIDDILQKATVSNSFSFAMSINKSINNTFSQNFSHAWMLLYVKHCFGICMNIQKWFKCWMRSLSSKSSNAWWCNCQCYMILRSNARKYQWDKKCFTSATWWVRKKINLFYYIKMLQCLLICYKLE